MNKQEQLLLLEEAILKNEALTSSLCAKWHGKPENVGRDIFLIAFAIVELNQKHNP